MAPLPYFGNMSSITQRFGRKMKELRVARNMSQLELSQKAGLDLTTVNELENGNREPILSTIWKLARALNVKESALLEQ